MKSDGDPNYVALQKLNNLLYSRPRPEAIEDDKSDEDDHKKELLFDVLVAQLKTLCCKKTKSLKRHEKKVKYQSVLNDFFPQFKSAQTKPSPPNEYMFLIVNDEIKSNGSDEIISVDPDSLEKNSSVLLLGPIATPLSDRELKSVVSILFK